MNKWRVILKDGREYRGITVGFFIDCSDGINKVDVCDVGSRFVFISEEVKQIVSDEGRDITNEIWSNH